MLESVRSLVVLGVLELVGVPESVRSLVILGVLCFLDAGKLFTTVREYFLEACTLDPYPFDIVP